MIVSSYAKINLALYVKNRRKDGFHNIETVFTQIDLKDRITLKKGRIITVETDNPDIPSGPKNLAFKAAEYIQKGFGVKEGVNIRIKKNIPLGAGLAGGSSNGAAVIKGLIDFFGLKTNPKKITKILKKLGADVPYCYLGGTALGRGKGERLIKLPSFTGYNIVLVYPHISVSTAWAYGNFKRHLTQGQNIVNLYKRYYDLSAGNIGIKDFLHNDFERLIFRKFPEIKRIRQDFDIFNPEGALMSGSGSTVFGLFKRKKNAEDAASFFGKQGFWVCITRPLAH